jgi:nucleotide-binding universal stress UspA family protein
MFKDILVPILSRRGDMDALNAGVALAESEDARLTVLQLVYLPTTFSSNWALARDVASGDIYRKLREEGEVNVARLKSRLETEPVRTEIRLVESSWPDASQTVAEQAYRTDLTVTSGALGDKPDSGVVHVFLASLFLASGGPVLVVPPSHSVAAPPRRIMVAWWPSREATRAVRDAMPLLQKAEVVDLVLVRATGGPVSDPSEQPVDSIVEHLAQHGVTAKLIVREPGRHAISTILLEHARESKAELLIAGGYGHSRLRESVLGGVTRELLISATIPVLYSH